MMIVWYGDPIPERRDRPEKNRPRSQTGQFLRMIRAQRYTDEPYDAAVPRTHRVETARTVPIGQALEYAVLRVEHWHPDGRPYLLLVQRTVEGWRAVREFGSVADALHYLGGRYMRQVAS